MRRTSETRLKQWLFDVPKKELERMQLQCVENLVKKSTPDVEGFIRGGEQFWIEAKCGERPARFDGIVRFKFQPGQSAWLNRRWNLGGAAWLLCQIGTGREARRYLLPGNYAQVAEDGITAWWIADVSAVPGESAALKILHTAARVGGPHLFL